MPSVNNTFALAGEPFKRYVKTVPSSVAGTRLNPMITSEARPIEFVLESNPAEFDPEAEVLEIYSDREDAYIQQVNRTLFRLGYLKEYDTGTAQVPTVNYSNMMTDEEVRSVAMIKTPAAMKNRLESITSYFTVMRVLRVAEDAGVKKSVLDVIRARVTELSP